MHSVLRRASWLATAALALVCVLPARGAAQTAGNSGTTPAITAADLRTRLYLIADDSMRGRLAGSVGDSLATAYIAAELARAGLVAAGENGGWFQTVHFREGGREPSIAARNVIGVLRGSDPVLQNEYVVISAHNDHVGIAAARRRPRLTARDELRRRNAEARSDGGRGAGVGDARPRFAARTAGATP